MVDTIYDQTTRDSYGKVPGRIVCQYLNDVRYNIRKGDDNRAREILAELTDLLMDDNRNPYDEDEFENIILDFRNQLNIPLNAAELRNQLTSTKKRITLIISEIEQLKETTDKKYASALSKLKTLQKRID